MLRALVRRWRYPGEQRAEINAIAKLQAMSQTTEFTQAAAQAAEAPLSVAQDLVTNPVSTISSVPKGIWGFLKIGRAHV